MHRQFLDERLRKRLAKERGEQQAPGTSLNKGKVKKALASQLDALNSTSWSSLETPSSLTNTTTTKKIRIGASIDSAAKPTPEEAKATSIASIAANILEEAKDGKEEDEEDIDEDVEGEADEEALVYEYTGGMDDYDDDGDDEYY